MLNTTLSEAELRAVQELSQIRRPMFFSMPAGSKQSAVLDELQRCFKDFPLLRLDLAGLAAAVHSEAEFKHAFVSLLLERARELGIEIPRLEQRHSLSCMQSLLGELPDGSLAVLVENSEAPLNKFAALEVDRKRAVQKVLPAGPEHEVTRSLQGLYYAMLRGRCKLRFALICGAYRAEDLYTFNEGWFFDDYANEPEFAALRQCQTAHSGSVLNVNETKGRPQASGAQT